MSLGLTILSIGIFNGLMLSFIFLRKKDHNLYLGFFILAHCLVLLKYLNDYSVDLNETFPILITGNLIEWTTAPLLYFYLRRYNDKPLPIPFLHFLPVVTMAFIHGFLGNQLIQNHTLFILVASAKVLQGLLYVFFALSEIKNNRWLKLFVILFIGEIASIAIYYFQLVFLDQLIVPELFLPIIIILILNVIAFSSMMKSSLFTSEPVKKLEAKDQQLLNRIFLATKEYVENTERYLSPNIKLSDLSKELGISEKLISQAINDSTGENINFFINRYRIRTAEQLLLNEDYSNITIDGIAEMSGFSNKVSFYKAFKRIHEISPKTFIKNHTSGK